MSPGSTNDGGMPSPLGITTGGFGDTMFGKPIVLPPVEREKKVNYIYIYFNNNILLNILLYLFIISMD